MKNTTIQILSIILFILVAGSCTKEALQNSNSAFNEFSDDDFIMPETASSLKKSNDIQAVQQLGLIVFKSLKNNGDWQQSFIRMKTADFVGSGISDTQPNQIELTLYEHVYNEKGAVTGNLIISTTLKPKRDKQFHLCYETELLAGAFKTNPTKKVIDAVVSYKLNNKEIATEQFSIFVFESGKTALQKPTLGVAHFIDDWQGETAFMKIAVKAENDPANEVAMVEVGFKEPFDGPKPTQPTFTLKSNKEDGHKMNGVISFTGDPSGFNYNLTLTMLNAKGVKIGDTQNTTAQIQAKIRPFKADAKEIAKTTGAGFLYRVVIIVKGDDNDEVANVAAVKVQFNEPFTGPKPNVTELMLINSTEKPKRFTVTCDCTAERGICLFNGKESVAGQTYNITATMLDSKGNVLGKPETLNITFESETDKTEPVVQSTRLFSIDGGKTWNYEAVIKDKANFIQKVEVQFLNIADGTWSAGPRPISQFKSLQLIDEKPDGTRIYSSKVEFAGNPTGFTYPVIIQQFGSGTRVIAGQANNKAELL